jgi:hypothetical protein
MKALLTELGPVYKWIVENGQDNPRALWIIGGFQFSAPPPYGGDLEKAAATLRRGVERAWQESLSREPKPGWMPTWGGPENLMNLAYMYAHVGTPDRKAALAYAEVAGPRTSRHTSATFFCRRSGAPVAVAAKYVTRIFAVDTARRDRGSRCAA